MNTPATDALTRKAERAQRLTLIPLAGLVILFIAWRTIVLPAEHAITILVIHILPLLLFVPGMRKRRPKVYIWFCFVILLYFCQGVMSSFALPTALGVLGLLETLLTVWVFCAAMMAGRYYARLDNIN